MFEDIAGRVAVVTGGARGIGFSLASGLARLGATVVLIDVLPAVVTAAEGIRRDLRVDAEGYAVNVTDPNLVEDAFDRATRAFGPPSILVTAAGITVWDSSIDVSPDSWRHVFEVNVNGTFFAAQSFARRALPLGQDASAIFVSSMSAVIVNEPQFQASYNASKAAVSHLAKSLAVEWAPHGVRVNAVAPGYVLSDMTRAFTTDNPDLARQWQDRIPVGRMAVPEDLDGVVALLASSASSYLTGQTIVVDGGYTAL